MSEYLERAGLRVDSILAGFVEKELLPDLDISSEAFWQGFEEIINALTVRNRALLERREELQAQLDEYHRTHPGQPEAGPYHDFLKSIGYLEPTVNNFAISTENVDPEIASVAGPQLVVPVSNARFALNAANARWGSLYDALYGTDVIDESEGKQKGGGYNPVRGDAVIAYAADFLDQAIPLETGSHHNVREYACSSADRGWELEVVLGDGTRTQPESR